MPLLKIQQGKPDNQQKRAPTDQINENRSVRDRFAADSQGHLAKAITRALVVQIRRVTYQIEALEV